MIIVKDGTCKAVGKNEVSRWDKFRALLGFGPASYRAVRKAWGSRHATTTSNPSTITNVGAQILNTSKTPTNQLPPTTTTTNQQTKIQEPPKQTSQAEITSSLPKTQTPTNQLPPTTPPKTQTQASPSSRKDPTSYAEMNEQEKTGFLNALSKDAFLLTNEEAKILDTLTLELLSTETQPSLIHTLLDKAPIAAAYVMNNFSQEEQKMLLEAKDSSGISLIKKMFTPNSEKALPLKSMWHRMSPSLLELCLSAGEAEIKKEKLVPLLSQMNGDFDSFAAASDLGYRQDTTTDEKRQLLLKRYPELLDVTHNEKTPFHQLQSYQDKEIQICLQAQKDRNRDPRFPHLSVQDTSGNTPLHLWTKNGIPLSNLNTLLDIIGKDELKKILFIKNNNGETPFGLLLKEGSYHFGDVDVPENYPKIVNTILKLVSKEDLLTYLNTDDGMREFAQFASGEETPILERILKTIAPDEQELACLLDKQGEQPSLLEKLRDCGGDNKTFKYINAAYCYWQTLQWVKDHGTINQFKIAKKAIFIYA